MIVGITGLIGSGKSLIGNYLNQSFRVPIIDCDDISRDLQNNIDYIKMIESALGKSFRERDNSFSRKKLVRHLYTNPGFIRVLDNIMHPAIINKTTEIIITSKSQNKHLIVLVPLLFECNMQNLFDKTVYVYTDNTIRKLRLIEKRKFKSVKHIEFFDGQQIPAEKKFLMCDHVILNNSEDYDDMYTSVKDLFLKIF